MKYLTRIALFLGILFTLAISTPLVVLALLYTIAFTLGLTPNDEFMSSFKFAVGLATFLMVPFLTIMTFDEILKKLKL